MVLALGQLVLVATGPDRLADAPDASAVVLLDEVVPGGDDPAWVAPEGGHVDDMMVEVESPLIPPPSCLIDGIQLGSGCTTGKRNLTVVEGPIGNATFRTKEGKVVVLSLRPDIPDRVRAWIEEIGVDKSGKRILEAPAEEFIERLE